MGLEIIISIYGKFTEGELTDNIIFYLNLPTSPLLVFVNNCSYLCQFVQNIGSYFPTGISRFHKIFSSHKKCPQMI